MACFALSLFLFWVDCSPPPARAPRLSTCLSVDANGVLASISVNLVRTWQLINIYFICEERRRLQGAIC